jgi:hypothetical protein
LPPTAGAIAIPSITCARPSSTVTSNACWLKALPGEGYPGEAAQ